MNYKHDTMIITMIIRGLSTDSQRTLQIVHFYKMLHWINWIVLLSLELLAGELK
jgi:hypothetical protein